MSSLTLITMQLWKCGDTCHGSKRTAILPGHYFILKIFSYFDVIVPRGNLHSCYGILVLVFTYLRFLDFILCYPLIVEQLFIASRLESRLIIGTLQVP